MKWFEWVVIFLSFWLLISPWVLGYSDLNLIVYNNLISAILIILFTLWHLPERYQEKNEILEKEGEEKNKENNF